MKIKVLSGPHAGEIQSVDSSAEFGLMAKLGFVEILPDLPKTTPRAVLTWTVCVSRFRQHPESPEFSSPAYFIDVSCSCGSRAGIPNPTEKSSWQCCGVGEFVPAAVLSEFRAMVTRASGVNYKPQHETR